MFIETGRFSIHMASQAEMQDFIERQSEENLRKAYQEMLDGCLEHPDCWKWHAIWMIELKDGTHVGDLSFKGAPADGSVEIGYGILESYRCRGYATEAVEAAVAWAFRQSGVIRVEAETEPENRASQRVLEKCGFAPTGISGKEGPRYERSRGVHL